MWNWSPSPLNVEAQCERLSNAFEPTNWLMFSLLDQTHHEAKPSLKCRDRNKEPHNPHQFNVQVKSHTLQNFMVYTSFTFLPL